MLSKALHLLWLILIDLERVFCLHGGPFPVTSQVLPSGTYKAVIGEGHKVCSGLASLKDFVMDVTTENGGQVANITAVVEGVPIKSPKSIPLYLKSQSRIESLGDFHHLEHPTCFNLGPGVDDNLQKAFNRFMRNLSSRLGITPPPRARIGKNIIFCKTFYGLITGLGVRSNRRRRQPVSADHGFMMKLSLPASNAPVANMVSASMHSQVPLSSNVVDTETYVGSLIGESSGPTDFSPLAVKERASPKERRSLPPIEAPLLRNNLDVPKLSTDSYRLHMPNTPTNDNAAGPSRKSNSRKRSWDDHLSPLRKKKVLSFLDRPRTSINSANLPANNDFTFFCDKGLDYELTLINTPKPQSLHPSISLDSSKIEGLPLSKPTSAIPDGTYFGRFPDGYKMTVVVESSDDSGNRLADMQFYFGEDEVIFNDLKATEHRGCIQLDLSDDRNVIGRSFLNSQINLSVRSTCFRICYTDFMGFYLQYLNNGNLPVVLELDSTLRGLPTRSTDG
ncbi:hypothetical protein FOL47_010857 [Perkinsus chesapeaki]|uniref:Uncharacterized protein n=1 Tax=Perkinsus chesapeaki TaxID=330153 RepID=A0A7J6KZZ7_PERCH|nr:hypothetical protein FOL47_010857 [Perkinsus chesapeaki]